MDTPVKFQGGKRLGSKSIKFRGGKRLGCWSSVDATIAAHTPAKACIAEIPPRISAKGPMEIRKREVSRHSTLKSQCALKLQLTRYRFLYQTRSKRSNLSLSIIPRKAVCWSSVDATTGAHTPAKACMAELPPWISAKGPIEIRKREVSFDKWAKWAIQQDMHALAQPVSSITATSTADQIAQAKEMDTPVKFQGGKRLG